jgi:hypothetical protein
MIVFFFNIFGKKEEMMIIVEDGVLMEYEKELFEFWKCLTFLTIIFVLMICDHNLIVGFLLWNKT